MGLIRLRQMTSSASMLFRIDTGRDLRGGIPGLFRWCCGLGTTCQKERRNNKEKQIGHGQRGVPTLSGPLRNNLYFYLFLYGPLRRP